MRSSSSSTVLSQDDAIRRLDSVQLLPTHSFPEAAQAISHVSNSLLQIQEKRKQESESNGSPIVLIVAGLDTLAEGIVRASNPVKGAAVLAATLRNLTRISRAYASFLCVMLVNTSGLGSGYLESDPKSHPGNLKIEDDDSRSSGGGGIYSIFHAGVYPLLSNLLMKTLDQGIDTHILLSDVRGVPVAEVIKDRVGPGLGKWSPWSRKH